MQQPALFRNRSVSGNWDSTLRAHWSEASIDIPVSDPAACKVFNMLLANAHFRPSSRAKWGLYLQPWRPLLCQARIRAVNPKTSGMTKRQRITTAQAGRLSQEREVFPVKRGVYTEKALKS
jgi:hypothetical protein